MKRAIIILITLIISAVPVFAEMPLDTLSFDEIAFQPVNGLNYGGVAFAFEIANLPSADANYNSSGPGQVEYVQDPSLEGNAAGVLTIIFDQPTTRISFGVAVSCHNCTLDDSVSVGVYRPGKGTLRTTVAMDTIPEVSWSEGWFEYEGPAVKTITVAFQGPFMRFALDNFSFHRGNHYGADK